MKKATAYKNFSVRKASGDIALFDEAKLRRSLHRSGADNNLIDQVLQEIQGQVYDDIPTKTLYKMAYKMLKRLNKPIAARYSLKQAMLELGPSGFPFEHFIAEILKAQGYSIQIGCRVSGKCIKHEVDVIAENDTEVIFVECKYHARAGTVSDVKIPLYLHSRFRDLEASVAVQRDLAGRKLQFRIATNTRFSKDAMRYGECAGLSLIAWDYPAGKGLRDMIDKAGLHPVTCLGTLVRHEKTKLLEKGVVLCRNLLGHPNILENIGISPGRQKTILEEVKALCQAQNPVEGAKRF